MSGGACPFCERVAAGHTVAANELAAAITDGFPVSPAHLLIVPRRHVADYFALTAAERHALADLVPLAKTSIEQAHAPDGYNLGMNIGASAGQTVEHAHLHVIPRYAGDVPDPRGGVRWVVPARAAYWRP